MSREKRRAGVSGGELAYVDEGDGPAVVLLHGFPTSSHLWRDLVPILAPRFRAIAPDLMGYGDSDRLEDPEALTIRAQARYVRELLGGLKVEDFAAVGHDIGGGVAQLLALEGGARTLILLDSIAFASWPIEAVRMLQTARPEEVDGSFVDNLVRLTFDLGMGDRGRLMEQDLEEYLRPWRDEPMALVRAARGIDGRGLDGIDDRLASLDTRTLIVWGEEDPFLPAELGERLGEVMPGATVALLPGCSHYVLEDAPQEVTTLVSRYLRTHFLGERHGAEHVGPTPVELGISFDRPEPSPDE
jgi:pimeloyl-ACP methyl ester carboxylesterase